MQVIVIVGANDCGDWSTETLFVWKSSFSFQCRLFICKTLDLFDEYWHKIRSINYTCYDYLDSFPATVTNIMIPELCRLMLRRLGKSRWRISLESWMELRLLLAMTRVSSAGNMEPNFRTSLQSWRLLSVMWSRRSVGQGMVAGVTVVYSLRHRNSSFSLDKTDQY